MGKFLLGFIVALLLIPIVGYVYLRYGHPPVAVTDAPFPFERKIVDVPLNARIDREMIKTPPFGTSEDVYEAGAHIYHDRCSSCHGLPGTNSKQGSQMFPVAPQLWKKHANENGVGVSDDDAGEIYWKVDNGIRLTGMPSFKQTLSTTQMWQVTLLLKNADQKLPDPVMTILQQPLAKQ